MVVTFTRALCAICEKNRLHECLHGLGKCVVCSYVRGVPEEEITWVN
jgi:hypothetical protein